VPVTGSLLGVFSDIDVGCEELRLDEGDTLVLLTDGVLEARHDRSFFDLAGVERVLGEAHPSADAVAAALEQAVLAHTGGMLTDDLAAVVLRVPRRPA
jgi:serine phosphatase RsbU (regulator of sigma subunit)